MPNGAAVIDSDCFYHTRWDLEIASPSHLQMCFKSLTKSNKNCNVLIKDSTFVNKRMNCKKISNKERSVNHYAITI